VEEWEIVSELAPQGIELARSCWRSVGVDAVARNLGMLMGAVRHQDGCEIVFVAAVLSVLLNGVIDRSHEALQGECEGYGRDSRALEGK
jgi:hypothetical protein